MHGAARGASRFPKTTIALWVIAVLALVTAGGMAGTREITDRDDAIGDSGRAQVQVLDAGLADRPTEAVLVRTASAARTDRIAADLQRRLEAVATVEEIQSPLAAGGSIEALRTADRRGVLLQVTLRGEPGDAAAAAKPVSEVVARAVKEHRGATIVQAGEGSVEEAIDTMVADDLARAELISLPITLVILVLAFGALVAASVPLVLGITAVAGAMGAVGLLSHLVPSGESTGSLVVLIGLAVGVDYSLFYVRREREERRAGREQGAALEAAAASVGRAILVSGLTVMVALAGLFLTGVADFRSMAVGTIVVTAIAVIGSLTVLPAMLTLLGDRVEAGRLRWPGTARRARRARRMALASSLGSGGAGGSPSTSRRRAARAQRPHGLLGALLAKVAARPVPALLVAVVLLGGLTIPAAGMRLGDPSAASFPAGIPAIDASRAIDRSFPGSQGTAELVVTGRGLDARAAQTGLESLGARAMALTGGSGPSPVELARDGRTAVVAVPMPNRGSSVDKALVGRLRAEIAPLAVDLVPGAEALLVTGEAAESADFSATVKRAMPLVGAFVLGLAFLLLLATFRSPRLALTVVALNLLSVGAAYGVMVGVFQHTWAEGLLGFTSSGAIVTWLPLIAFVILFGLSMDYSILVLERIREARLAGRSPREAAAEGVAATAGTVTGAAVVMVAVFMIFATLRMLEMKQLGVGLAAAILIDATIVRAIALPAAVALLGERAFPLPGGSRGRAAGAVRESTGGREAVCDDAAMANPGLIRQGADA